MTPTQHDDEPLDRSDMDDAADIAVLLGPAGSTPVVSQQEQQALDELAAAVMRRRSRTSRRVGVVATGAAALTLVGTAAAATMWTTHTGVFSRSYGVDAGEYLDPHAPDFAATVQGLTPTYSLPAAGSWAPLVARIITLRQSAQSGGQETDRVITRQIETLGWCAWTQQWEQTAAADDGPGKQAALDGLRTTLLWRDLMLHPTDGLSSAVRQSVQAAERGDAAAMDMQRYSLCD